MMAPRPLLLIDVGNSTTRLTLATGDDLMTPAFMKTSDLSKDALSFVYAQLFEAFEQPIESLLGVAVSSVCPRMNALLCSWAQTTFGIDPWFIGAAEARARWIAPGVAKDEVGEDLIADAIGGALLYRPPLVIADLGTALTIQLVDAAGRMAGVAIAPGIDLQMTALSGGTALLDTTPFLWPETLFGQDTPTALMGGIGGSIAGLVALGRAEAYALWGEMPKVIATGGQGAFLTRTTAWAPTPVADLYDDTLLWHGLKHAFFEMHKHLNLN